MGHFIEWVIPDRVVHVKITGAQTLEEIAVRSREIIRLLDSSLMQHVHFIYDNSELTQLPSDLRGLKKSVTWTQHPKVGWVVSYNGRVGPVMYVVRVLTRFLNMKYSDQISYAHALHFLVKKDPALGETIQDFPEKSAAY